MEQYKRINGTDYTLVRDYYLPNLLPHQEAARPVGAWGERRMDYVKQHRKVLFTNLLTSGKLHGHLADTDKRAEEMYSSLVERMVASEGVILWAGGQAVNTRAGLFAPLHLLCLGVIRIPKGVDPLQPAHAQGFSVG